MPTRSPLFARAQGMSTANVNSPHDRAFGQAKIGRVSPIPAGLSRNEWGLKVWGQGAKQARQKIGARSADELRELGLTVERATKLRDFYESASQFGRGAEAARARVELMDDIIKTLGG